MSESVALAVIEEKESATALMRMAGNVAAACREIVMRTAMELQGKKYVKVEGWASIAAAYGCVPTIREVVEEERGIRAIADLVRHDGKVIASAEGYCGLDEPRWATQPLYARRGMAQTRAVSRVCRTAFAFGVVMIDEGRQTTPAEEIPQGGEVSAAPAKVRRMPIQDETTQPAERSKRTTVRYGRDKGKFLCDVDDLSWIHAAAKKGVEANDPKWGASNIEWLKAVEEELARRNQ